MTHQDDVRPMPQRGLPPPKHSPSVAAADGGPEQEVYLVDTRGRRRVVKGGTPPAKAPGRIGAAPRTTPPPPPDTVRPSRAHHRRHRARVAVVLLVVALLAWGGFLLYTPWHAWSTVARVDAMPTTAQGTPASAGHVYLLVGSDSRAGLTTAQKQSLGTGSVAGQRTDTIILVYVPSGGGKSALISIPRDSYVPIPGHGNNKINAAYAFGGAKLLIETIERATDLRIDGYMEVGFAGFAGIVDSLGGVSLCVPFTMNDKRANINLKKGCQTLNGPNALGYVRARYSDPRGDIGRAERQRQLLGAIMKKAVTPSTVLIPTRWWDFTHNATGPLTVGQDTSLMDAGRIALAMRGVSDGSTLSLVVPLASVSYLTAAGDAVKWDAPRAKALFTALRDGTPLTGPPSGTNGVPSGG